MAFFPVNAASIWFLTNVSGNREGEGRHAFIFTTSWTSRYADSATEDLRWGRQSRDADKSLALPWKETSYSDQDSQHYTKTYGVQTTQ